MIYALVIIAPHKAPNPILYCYATSEIAARNSDVFKNFFKVLAQHKTSLDVKVVQASEAYETIIELDFQMSEKLVFKTINEVASFVDWVVSCADIIAEKTKVSISIIWNQCSNEIGMKVAAGPRWKITQRLYTKGEKHVRKASRQ